MDRYLIVNADDFGQSPGVSRGILKAHVDGIVTSTSLMVRWPAAAEAVAAATDHPDLSLGLHVDLGEWRYRQGEWEPVYRVVPPDDAQAVTAEVRRQLEDFRELVGRDPTHLDSHQHAHRAEPLRSILLALAEELDVPIRHLDPDIAYCGDFYGQDEHGEPIPGAVGWPRLAQVIRELQPGITELACHPGYAGEDLDTMYRQERVLELEALCSPYIHDTVEAARVHLVSFADVTGRLTDASAAEA